MRLVHKLTVNPTITITSFSSVKRVHVYTNGIVTALGVLCCFAFFV